MHGRERPTVVVRWLVRIGDGLAPDPVGEEIRERRAHAPGIDEEGVVAVVGVDDVVGRLDARLAEGVGQSLRPGGVKCQSAVNERTSASPSKAASASSSESNPAERS